MPRITCLWEGLIFREISRRRLLDSVLPKQELDHDIPWGRLAHRRMFVAGAKPLEPCPAKKSITRPSTTVWSMSFMERRGNYMRIKDRLRKSHRTPDWLHSVWYHQRASDGRGEVLNLNSSHPFSVRFARQCIAICYDEVKRLEMVPDDCTPMLNG